MRKLREGIDFLASDIVAAITKKGPPKPCESCGHDDWLMPADEPDLAADPAAKPLAQIMAMTQPSDLTSQYTFAALICRNCANTRFFSTHFLLGGSDGK